MNNIYIYIYIYDLVRWHLGWFFSDSVGIYIYIYIYKYTMSEEIYQGFTFPDHQDKSDWRGLGKLHFID